MSDSTTIIEGHVKFRDGKKWKSRWCVVRKLSPVADCLHLQLYRDSKDRYKQGQTKASLSLQHFLGLEKGFTLDKESNTLAIICKDLTVVLAFDTRERLIQWHVKISSHLGKESQFVVQVSSAPARAKLSPGPAHLHLQEYRFSLTTGVPPRLVGVWDISKLRRYGVVERRFCFEGGSRCGKGEGLYVLVTDQGEEITRAFRLASEGQLDSTRASTRHSHHSNQESSGRAMTRLSQASSELSEVETLSQCTSRRACSCGCSSDDLSVWPSCETRPDLPDTASVIDSSDLLNGVGTVNRCVSCMSKLGGPLSRSSTITAQDVASPLPWPSSISSGARSCCCSTAGSVYSVPRHTSTPAPPVHNLCGEGRLSGSGTPGQTLTKKPKPPMPLPQDPADNYDVPRPFISPYKEERCVWSEEYDTPKRLTGEEDYGNYDRPPPPIRACPHHPPSPPPTLATRVVVDSDERCPCHGVMCWPSAWLPLPYCRRATPSHTSVHLHKVKLSGEGKMPVVNSIGEVAVYATVDMSKKSKYREEDKDKMNYINVEPAGGKCEYENLEFAQSLEHYENSRDLVRRAGMEDYLVMGPGPQRRRSADSTPLATAVARRSASVPSKTNRDSSSSADSGVSEPCDQTLFKFELPPTTSESRRRYLSHRLHECLHSSLPRRSKSSDPLRELTFHFPKIKVPAKSSSAEAEVPICLNEQPKVSPVEGVEAVGLALPYIDSRSSSSGASDMSDYMETLSLSSHSSSDCHSTRLGHLSVTTLRPRSGKEYHKIDRYILEEEIKVKACGSDNSGGNSSSGVPETTECSAPVN